MQGSAPTVGLLGCCEEIETRKGVEDGGQGYRPRRVKVVLVLLSCCCFLGRKIGSP
jgi:hypothetical protein